MIIRPVPGDLIDVAVHVAPTAEGDQGDPRGRCVHRKVRQQLRHEIQLAAEVLRADRAGCVHQEHHFHLVANRRCVRIKRGTSASLVLYF